MVWWIDVREIADHDGKPTGRYRLTRKSDEDGGGPYGFCECPDGHATADEARDCPEAKEKARRM